MADVDALLDLFETFFAESGYPPAIEFDRERASHYLTMAIGTGHEPHIIAPLGDNYIMGSISYEIDHTFSKQPFAVLGEVYARPEFRNSGLGRVLVESAMDLAKHDGATCMHIPITSGHKSVPTLVNLFRKFGAEEIGTIMRKVL